VRLQSSCLHLRLQQLGLRDGGCRQRLLLLLLLCLLLLRLLLLRLLLLCLLLRLLALLQLVQARMAAQHLPRCCLGLGNDLGHRRPLGQSCRLAGVVGSVHCA
jgi:hypothetical protein